MKPRSRDIKINILISGDELTELKRHAWMMVEAFGLDSRIENYKGTRPIGFYRWDLECLIDTIDCALDDKKELGYALHSSSYYMQYLLYDLCN